jgi:hypothetical protein
LGRIRIDVRGNTVGSAIDLADPIAASELSGRIHELEAALQRRGLESSQLSVNAIRADAAEVMRSLAHPNADGVTPATWLDTLLSQQRQTDRQADSGRQQHEPLPQRRSRGDQQKQEGK